MIPDFQSLMLPVLRLASEGEQSISDVVRRLEDQFELSEAERRELLPSGRQARFANRVHWAKSYLLKGGLIEATRRAHFQITDAGRAVLADPPERISLRFLKQLPSYAGAEPGEEQSVPAQGEQQAAHEGTTPDERLRQAHSEITEALAAELLSRLRKATPAFFEQVIVDLLLAMGYGTDMQAGQVLGQSGDNGVDGVINQDPLGVDQVYVQAKKYAADNRVGAGAVREFFGALSLKDVSKGILVTTSDFSREARNTAAKLGARIVLIDGKKLADLLVAHEIGCRLRDVLRVSELDEGYFEE